MKLCAKCVSGSTRQIPLFLYYLPEPEAIKMFSSILLLKHALIAALEMN